MNKQVAFYKFLDRFLSAFISVIPKKKSIEVKEPRKILIIKFSAMGDCLSLFPSVRMMAEAMPGARIEWLTSQRSNPFLFSNLNFISKIHAIPKSTINTLIYLIRFLIKARGYDLIIDYDQYYRVSELISAFGKRSAGFQAPLKGNSFNIKTIYDPMLNEKMMFKKLTEKILSTYNKSLPHYDFALPELVRNHVASDKALDFSDTLKAYGLPVVAIYPGSSMNALFRRWPTENYIDLSERLSEVATVLFVGGKDEEALISGLRAANIQNIAINRFSLFDLLWLFSNTIDVVIGNDGGLLHVAESQKVPICGIFGPALYKKWGSINSNSKGIEVDLACRPCLQNYNGIVPNQCPLGTIECLKSIDVSRVDLEAKKILGAISIKVKCA
jgi:ADP-heptose:LPS heptosyltransferase